MRGLETILSKIETSQTKRTQMASHNSLIERAQHVWAEMGPRAWGRTPTPGEEATLREALKKGWFNTGAIVEDAVANSGNLIRDPNIGRDFNDGTDSKKTTAQKAGKKSSGEQRWKACVTGIKNKCGGLRIAIDTTKIPNVKHRFVYAVVPYHVYENYTGDTLSIELDFRGKIVGLFEKYAMATLDEMANAKFYKGNVIRTNHPRYHEFI